MPTGGMLQAILQVIAKHMSTAAKSSILSRVFSYLVSWVTFLSPERLLFTFVQIFRGLCLATSYKMHNSSAPFIVCIMSAARDLSTQEIVAFSLYMLVSVLLGNPDTGYDESLFGIPLWAVAMVIEMCVFSTMMLIVLAAKSRGPIKMKTS
jgi:hypothetical protein